MSRMAVESLHPRTGGLPRPGSAGYGAGGLLPLESGVQADGVLAGVRGLDAEVAAAAAKRQQEKQWKATFMRDKEAIEALGFRFVRHQTLARSHALCFVTEGVPPAELDAAHADERLPELLMRREQREEGWDVRSPKPPHEP